MIGIGLALFAWSLSRLTPDAVALALGLTLGVIGCIPATLLVLSAGRRRDSEDDDDVHFSGLQGGDYVRLTGGGFNGVYRREPQIDAHPTTYADEVTPYTHLARQAMGMPPLPDRQAQISELEAYLDHLKTQRDMRQFVLRWEGEAH